MKAFEYASPQKKEDAVKLLGGNAAVLAGGTDLLSLMKDHVASPSRLVSLKAVSELRGIQFSPQSGLRIGAMATLDELAAHSQVKNQYPAITKVLERLGGPQIRHMGTLGGNLCQRPRCWYYRNGFGLLAMHNGKSMVADGDDRFHAILGNQGPAYFVSPSSVAPALIALGAKVKILGSGGTRDVALQDLYVIPKSQSESEFSLKPGEILLEILVPAPGGRKNASYEIRQRESLEWPLAMASVSFTQSGSSVRDVQIVLGQVAPKPWVAAEAAQFLNGKSITPETAEQAGEIAVRGARALKRNGYKIRLARVAVKRALLRAGGTEV